MKMRLTILTAIAATLAVSAQAADLPVFPVKASPVVQLPKGYPYGSNGFIFGLYTAGGGGTVNGVSVPGVNTNSLTTTQASIGATVGYGWGSRVSPFAFTVEQDVGVKNFNGSQNGLSLNGPLELETTFNAFTPLSTIANLLPGLPSWTVPPFAPLQPGVIASNIQSGIRVGWHWDDVSVNYPGLPQFREWSGAPVVGLVAMEQLSNGMALRAIGETIFPSKGVCVGPFKTMCAGTGQQYVAKIQALF